MAPYDRSLDPPLILLADLGLGNVVKVQRLLVKIRIYIATYPERVK